jgi:hypothetical protein
MIRRTSYLRRIFVIPLTITTRTFSTTSSAFNDRKLMGDNPQANMPDTLAARNRSDTPNTDPQSNASKDEHKTGDDHPARQPDYQEEPTKKTRIGGGSEVEGGKEGLGKRTDKQGWDPEKERKRGQGVATD